MWEYEELGLSPRMRGNRLCTLPVPVGIGSIPAHAGKSGRVPPALLTTWVYPRACGEIELNGVSLLSTQGLSPRMRGNREECEDGVDVEGSIPAHAGKSKKQNKLTGFTWVYPRACGEISTAWITT